MGGSGGQLFESFRYILCKDQDDFEDLSISFMERDYYVLSKERVYRTRSGIGKGRNNF